MFALLKKVQHELSLLHKSHRREQRDLTMRCDVRVGRPHSLICLQIQSSLGGPPPSPPPSELNNLNVGLHAHVIINELCPCPFHPPQNKNKVKSACLPVATPGITNVLKVLQSKDVHQILQTLLLQITLLWQELTDLQKAYPFLMLVKFL